MKSLTTWLSGNRGYMRQILVCVSVSILPFIHGMLLAWPSLAIERLMGGVAGFSVTENDVASIVPMLNIGMFLMPIVFGFILVKIGRKSNFILNAAIYVVSWTLFIFADSSLALVIANLLSGLGSGIAIIIGPIYIAEIADKRIRGALISLFITAVAMGEAFLTSAGIFISYFELNVIPLVLTVVALFAIIILATESPCWYFMSNKEEEAEKSFKYYWNTKSTAEDPMASTAAALVELKATVDAEMKSASSYRELFRTPSNVRASIIVIVLSLLQAATGISAMLAYASTTLPKYDGFWEPNPTMALFNILDLGFNVVSMGLIDRWGRKPLSIISNVGNALGTGLITVYFFIDEYSSFDTTDIKWLPYIGSIVFISFYGVAMATMPHLLVGELFPANVRYHASVVSVCCIAASFAFFSFIYLYVCHYAGVSVMYFIFTLFNVGAAWFSYVYIFETKNLSLAEIQLKAGGISQCALTKI